MTEKIITAQNVDKQIKALYETAFPLEEQVPWKDLLRLIGEMTHMPTKHSLQRNKQV